MKLVGTVGRIGAGKDTVINHLHRCCHLPVYSLGDLVRQRTVERGRDINRGTLQEVARREIAEHGELVFIRRLVNQLRQDALAAAGITGLRKPEEIRFLKSRFGDQSFLLVHVRVSSPEIRYRRLRERAEPRDPENFADFMDQDRREEQLFHIGEAIAMADVTLDNDGSPEDLSRRIVSAGIKGFLALGDG